ncbi:MAG: inosine/xanthosine triphosphatase [Candidatus Hodarchaeota archaeon]
MITVGVGTKNVVKINAVRNVFSKIWEKEEIVIESLPVESEVSPQPLSFEETVLGAYNRAFKAKKEGGEKHDFYVGIEAGIIPLKIPENMVKNADLIHPPFLDIQVCVILRRKDDKISIGLGPGFAYPPEVIEGVKEGKTVNEIMGKISNIENIGSKIGAIGFLTCGVMKREKLTEQAVLTALIPFIPRNEKLFKKLKKENIKP